MQVILVDAGQNEILTAGETGEIWVAGIQTSPGYYLDPDATAHKFKPLVAAGGETAFQTGDMAWYDLNRNLHFVGRRDQQVCGVDALSGLTCGTTGKTEWSESGVRGSGSGCEDVTFSGRLCSCANIE